MGSYKHQVQKGVQQGMTARQKRRVRAANSTINSLPGHFGPAVSCMHTNMMPQTATSTGGAICIPFTNCWLHETLQAAAAARPKLLPDNIEDQRPSSLWPTAPHMASHNARHAINPSTYHPHHPVHATLLLAASLAPSTCLPFSANAGNTNAPASARLQDPTIAESLLDQVLSPS